MSTALTQTVAEITRGIDLNLHPGGQVWVWQEGRGAAEAAVGEAQPGVAMRSDHLLGWMSMTKPVVAAAVMQCVERGQPGLDDPVSRHIPEFAQQGKEAITVRHLLTHTAGLRPAATNDDPRPWAQIIAAICAAAPEAGWAAGQKAGYHIASSWYVLGELVQRVDGRPIDRYVREAIFEPLGMNDSWLAIKTETSSAPVDRIAMRYRTDGRSMEPDPSSVDAETLARVSPGASGRGPAHDLGRFYRMLLGGGELDGQRVLSAGSVEAMVRRQRVGMLDQTFRQVMDWGLGLIINSRHQTPLEVLPYNFGPGASADAFGHGGAQSSVAFADPVQRVAAVIIFNGMPGEPKHHGRMRGVLAALWADLEAGRS